jgi:hypothetical protein
MKKTLIEWLEKREEIEDRLEDIDFAIQCEWDEDHDDELYDLERKLAKANRKILKLCKQEIAYIKKDTTV